MRRSAIFALLVVSASVLAGGCSKPAEEEAVPGPVGPEASAPGPTAGQPGAPGTPPGPGQQSPEATEAALRAQKKGD